MGEDALVSGFFFLVFFVFFVDPFDSCFRFWFRLFFYQKQPLKEAPLLCLRPKISKLQRSFSRSFDNLSGRLRLSIENFVGGEELKVFSGSPKSATPRTRRPSAERQRLQRTFMQKTEKDNITPGIIEKSEDELERLMKAAPQSQGDSVSIAMWKGIHKVFLDNAKKKGGRKRSRRKKRRRTKKRKSRRRKKRSRRRRRKKR